MSAALVMLKEIFDDLSPPGQIPLKVPTNIEFGFAVSVDREHWQTGTSKSTLMPYNSVQMSIRCTVSMYC